jgi:hypothetical protein
VTDSDEALRTYREKRDFTRTDEPAGGEVPLHRDKPVFTIQKHAATALHYDLRLEGVADPAEGGPESADLKAISQWYTSLLEKVIRRAPSQYWWVHRRWRGGPPKATVARAAA